MEVIENTFEGGINSELQVASTDRADNGLFTCTAANAYGEDKRTIKLSVLGQLPSSSESLEVSLDSLTQLSP